MKIRQANLLPSQAVRFAVVKVSLPSIEGPIDESSRGAIWSSQDRVFG
jgi:hypothetical protein